MKKILLSVLALLAFTFGGTAQNLPSYVPANGLVGWWPFNGNANDESGNNNNGTVNGSTLTTDRLGNAGNAYGFDGINNFIRFSNTFIFNSNQNGTVSFWFKSNTISGIYSTLFFSRGSAGESSRYNYYLQPPTGGSTFRLATDYREENINQHVLNETAFDYFQHGQWFNITITRVGADYNLHINGMLHNTIQDVNPNNPNSVGWLLGSNPNGQNFFDGNIDDILFYNRALTQNEITALYQGNTTTANCLDLPNNLQQGLVGYWPFCGNALDESGNGNHGTVNGATLTTDRFGNAGSAYGFDGVDDFILVNGSGPALSINNNFSIRLWAKLNSNGTNWQHLIVKGDNTSNEYSIISRSDSTLHFDHQGIQTLSNVEFGDKLNSWNQIICVNDNGTSKVYLNGSLVSTNTLNNPITSSTLPLIFGTFYNNATQLPDPQYSAKGQLDDIAIWNRALTQQEITQLYNQGVCQTSITVTDTLLIHTGITSYNPVAYGNTLKLWPNPSNTAITLDAGNLALMQGWKIRISNAQGAQIYPATGQTGLISQQQQTLSMSGWGGNGLYFLYLIDPQNNIQEVKKIVLAP